MVSERAWADAEIIWDFHQMHHEPRPCSVVVGLGSLDLGFADTTVDLYRRGMAPLIVFTGATSRTTQPHMPRGEAVHYHERALELGVPPTTVLVEPSVTDTGENIRFARALLRDRGVAVESVLLVSKPYEERRALRPASCGPKWRSLVPQPP